jgi:hypothetical protein
VWDALGTDGQFVLTNNGRPQALVIGVDSESLTATIEDVRQARLARLVAAQQAASVAAGLDHLTMDQIDAEVTAARKARRARS